MTQIVRYVLDANVFIEAARKYYAFDLAPTFWKALIDQAENGRLCSIDHVQKELNQGKDELAKWSKMDGKKLFISTARQDIIDKYNEIIAWVQVQTQYMPDAKSNFAKAADGWLVAHACVCGGIVVTHEKPSREAKNRIPIPNVCKQFRVPFTDTFAMLRNLGIKLG